MFMDTRCIWFHRLDRVKDKWQILIANFDHLYCRSCLCFGLCDNRRDLVPYKADHICAGFATFGDGTAQHGLILPL